MFASMLGTILVIVLAFLAFFTFLVLVVSGLRSDRTESISSNTVLEIKGLVKEIREETLTASFIMQEGEIREL
jgi:hypothetical protein